MEQDDKKVLPSEFNEKKRKIRKLRNELNLFNEEKEKWYNIKAKLGQKISNLIKGLKQDRGCRDNYTSEVKSKKEERDKINQEIKEKIEVIKKINQEKKETLTKFKIQKDPILIKNEIEKLEQKIETEAMSYNNEKKIMKLINDLKKKYKEIKELSSVWESAHNLSKEINELQRKSDNLHKEIQKKAEESQIKHENLIDASDEIKKINADEKIAFEKFVEYKNKFIEVNNELKKELEELGHMNNNITEIKQKKVSKKFETERSKLKAMELDVEKKIKSRQKLTTEDLLIIQESQL